MVEGGAAVITNFLAQHLVDVVVLTIAPMIVGGKTGVESLVAAGSGKSKAAFLKLQEFGTARLGDDLIVWGKPACPEESAINLG